MFPPWMKGTTNFTLHINLFLDRADKLDSQSISIYSLTKQMSLITYPCLSTPWYSSPARFPILLSTPWQSRHQLNFLSMSIYFLTEQTSSILNIFIYFSWKRDQLDSQSIPVYSLIKWPALFPLYFYIHSLTKRPVLFPLYFYIHSLTKGPALFPLYFYILLDKETSFIPTLLLYTPWKRDQLYSHSISIYSVNYE